MTRFMISSAGIALPAFLLAAAPASAIDPARINASPQAERMAATPEPAPRRGGRGIFGCSAQGNKQTAGAVVGGLLGGFLGNRIAGRGNRTVGTLLGGALGAAGGSALGCKLQKDDRAKAEQAMQTALVTGQNQGWESSETGSSGQIELLKEGQGQSLAGLKFAQGVEPWTAYRQIGAAYVTRMAANVRSRPGTDGQIVGQLPAGTRIWVPAAAQDTPWFLIADKGMAQGYVSNALVEPVPPASSPCRMVKQSISLADGSADSETYQACPDADGQWVLTRV